MILSVGICIHISANLMMIPVTFIVIFAPIMIVLPVFQSLVAIRKAVLNSEAL